MTKKDEDQFLVPVREFADHSSLLGCLAMNVISELPVDEYDALLKPVKIREGLIDVRLVIEGREIPFALASKYLEAGWEQEKQKALRQYIDENLHVLQKRLREAAEPVIRGFGRSMIDDGYDD